MGFWSRGHKFTHESEVSLTGQPSVFHSCISGSPDIFLVGNSVSCNTVGNNVLHGMGNDGDDEPSICLSFLGVTAHVTVKIVHLFHLRLHPQVQSYNPSERLIIYDQFAFPETRGVKQAYNPTFCVFWGDFVFIFPEQMLNPRRFQPHHWPYIWECTIQWYALELKTRHHCQLWWKNILEKTCRNICLYIYIYISI